MRLKATFCLETKLWEFTCINNSHNHTGTTTASAHAVQRAITTPIQNEIARYADVGTKPRSILAAIQHDDPSCNLILRDVYNSIANSRKTRLNQTNFGQVLIHHFEEHKEDYLWHLTSDLESHIEYFFLSRRSSIDIFKAHPDIVILDCTYKTNAYKIPLLNDVGVTGNNTTIQLAVVFLQSENEEHLTWAMRLLRELFTSFEIPAPIAFFTDQEAALVNAIESIFPTVPTVPTVLCLWHVFKNVIKYAKKHGNNAADIEVFDTNSTGRKINIRRHETPEFTEFIKTFTNCVQAPTEEVFEEWRADLHRQSSGIANYIDSQYFDLWKHKIAACCLIRITLFGIQTISRGEGSHNTMKSWLRTSKVDIYTFWSLMDKLWRQ